MAVVFNIDHETGNLTQYTNSSGAVSATAGAKLVGNYGLNVVVSTTVAWARKTATQAAIARFRMYVNPNAITMANGDAFVIQNIQQNAGSYSVFEQLQLKYVTGQYQLAIDIYDDAGYLATYTQNITNATHYVEVNYVRAATVSSIDGTFAWWIDGVAKDTRASIDNFNKFSDQAWQLSIGAVTGVDAGTSGTIFLDDWVLNDDGGTIGPAGGGTSYTLLTTTGVFVETGSNAILKSNLHVLASAGVFILTGSNAILGKRAQLLASTGAFIETGNNAIFKANLHIRASAGSFVETGNNATFKTNLHILTSAGTFTETGLNATFLYNRKLFTATGAFTETGANLVFLFNHKFYTVAGIFALTGNIANLIYRQAGAANYLLWTTAGVFVLTGCNARLVYNANSPAPLVPAGAMNIRKQVTMHPESMMTGHGFQPGGVTTRGNRWPGNIGSGKK